MERKKYALVAAAFLMNSLPDNLFRKVREVVLFGSIATDTAGPDSDIDIFIDVDMKIMEIAQVKRIVKKSIRDFTATKDALRFKLGGIDNPLSVRVGKLDEWKDLKDSIESSGIVLYGAYVPLGKSGGKYLIFYWERLGIPNRGALLNRLYGYRIGKRYPGLLEKIGGRRIGKSAVLVPAQHRNEIMLLMKKYNVDYKILQI
jgi:predicted nucleotidyltransferase